MQDDLGYEETYAYDSPRTPKPGGPKDRGNRVQRADRLRLRGQTEPDRLSGDQRLTTEPFSVRHVYNDFWCLKEIRSWLDADSARQNNQLQGRVFWRTDSFTAAGRIDSEIHGNGLANDRVYSTATGRLLHAAIDRAAAIGTSYAVQNLWYEYDRVGNVIERRDQASGRDERFYTAGSPTKSDGYDGLDRLMVHRVIGGAEITLYYFRNGNISYKSDVGSYSYSVPHAVGYAGSRNYGYDANGSMMLSGYGSNARYTDWTSFGQLWKISSMQTQKSALFSFDAAGQRVKQERFSNTAASGTPDETTIYVGGIYEKVGAGDLRAQALHPCPTGRVAVHTDRTSLVRDTRFLHTDGLGSIRTISDERGRVVRQYTYDAPGQTGGSHYTNPAPDVTNAAPTTRGFTDHEGLTDFGLVHMNGRIYDPVVGRFMTADPFVGDANDGQEYNRYSYVANNPLGGTDPSGFFSLKDAVKIVAIVVASYFTAGLAVYAVGASSGATLASSFAALSGSSGFSLTFAGAVSAGAGAGFGSGFAGSLLNGGSIGDAFKAGVIGGVAGGITGGLTHGIGQLAHAGDLGYFGHAGAHGVVHGAAAEATGGEFRHGFYSGFFSAAAGPSIEGLAENAYARTSMSAVVGGTASVLGGGKFANGAVSGAFIYMLNEAQATTFEENGKTIRLNGASPFFTPADRDGAEYYDLMNGASVTGIAADRAAEAIVTILASRFRATGFEKQKGPDWGSAVGKLLPSMERALTTLTTSFSTLGMRDMASIHSRLTYQERRGWGIFKWWGRKQNDFELVKNPTGFPSNTRWTRDQILNVNSWGPDYTYTAIGHLDGLLTSKLK
ncbi:MAG: RHS repeat-associated core domain-containing protein [Opitutaceae bacterium]|nr:RHS repeat-associated core domain-containing protein [Opitutaceae bacterium]